MPAMKPVAKKTAAKKTSAKKAAKPMRAACGSRCKPKG